jgi:basic amino acid/polyamine antiporter, APA family
VSAPPATPALRRTLTVAHVSVAGVGVILGAGVYALIAPAAGHAGDALWLAFVLAGVTAGLTAYAYARLGSMQPKASAEFQYTSLAFGPRVGFFAGWLMLAADVFAAAAVAVGFGGYVAHLAGTPPAANALALVLLVAVVLYTGVRLSIAVAVVLTALEAAGLLFVIAVGVPSWTTATYALPSTGWPGVATAAALIFFAYLGFDELGNFAEEMHEPARDLPRALLISMVVTTAIYVLVAVSAVAAVGSRALSESVAPLAVVARRTLGPTGDTAMSAIALAATANTVLLLLASAARSVYGMAAAGVLPRALAAVGPTAIPVRATISVLVVAGAAVMAGNLTEIAALTDAAVLMSFILVNLSLPWLAVRGATAGGRPRRWADVILPAGGVLLCTFLVLHTGWRSLLVAGVVGAVGMLIPRRGDTTSL